MVRMIHFDEARAGAVNVMREVLSAGIDVERAVIVDDLFGRIRVIVWLRGDSAEAPLRESMDAKLRSACGSYWTGDLWCSGAKATPEDRFLHDAAWAEGVAVDAMERLRLNDRHRNRKAWFLPVQERPLWPSSDGPKVVVFHSFKGGVGRTTALASYAISCAREGKRVAVIDFDLDAPGVGLLLDSDGQGATARWGVVDFLLEVREGLPLEDYHHTCSREGVTNGSSIEVFPAGALDDAYLTKLSRVDLDGGPDLASHPLATLLRRIHDERAPSVILVDGRAGLSPAAGLLLSGFAHMHMLFATTSPQSLAGLQRVVHHLGYEQARRGLPQAECMVVQAMVPDNTEVARLAEDTFAARVEGIFSDDYYAERTDEEDRVWSVDDMSSSVAPHVPVPISYRGKLAHFRDVAEVADTLVSDPDYVRLRKRLDERLGLSGGEAV